MKTDVIKVDNQENGYEDVLLETRKAANYRGLSHKQAVQLQLIAEEMLSMLHSITGEMEASFWIESEGRRFELNMSTNTVMDMEKRQLLISSTTEHRNAAANSFLGKLRDAFEQAMASQAEHTYFELPNEVQADLAGRVFEDPEWDRYEQSVLLKLADDVKIAIRGGQVDMTVSKTFN